MGEYQTRWEKLKKDFETNANMNRPKESVKKAIVGTVAKSSGITPIVKEIDTALAKKERKPLEQAINKLMATRGAYGIFLQKEQLQYNPMNGTNPDPEIFKAFRDLIYGMEAMETDAGKAAEKLQEDKGAAKAIPFFSIEGDLKGTLATAKKGLAPFPAMEKKYGLLKKADGAVKQAEAYTKAAARTQIKEAKEALIKFKAEAKKCADELDKVLQVEKEEKFHKALQAYHDPMKALAAVTRVDAQIANLTKMEQPG